MSYRKTMENYRKEQLKKYNGVRSWLLLLCVLLTIGIPIISFYNIFTIYLNSHKYFHILPSLERYFYIDLVLSLIVIILSIRSGIALWTLQEGAVKTAKIYLVVYLSYAGISLFLPLLVGISTEIDEVLIIEIILSSLQALIFFGVWNAYLNVSRRVKVTYQ